jgi:hypothetical protein
LVVCPARQRAALLGCLAGVLGFPLALASQASAGPWSDPLLERLQAAGVSVVWRADCGGPRLWAAYNMGANELCLGAELGRRPQERATVLRHEVIHVVQDCLDGLETPTSLTLAEALRASGRFSSSQLNGFFLQYLRRQDNWRHVVATTAPLPLDSRQREMEAYALQVDPALVSRLLALHCPPKAV